MYDLVNSFLVGDQLLSGGKQSFLAGKRRNEKERKDSFGILKSVPFGSGSNRKNIKRNSFTKGRIMKESSGIPFGGVPD